MAYHPAGLSKCAAAGLPRSSAQCAHPYGVYRPESTAFKWVRFDGSRDGAVDVIDDDGMGQHDAFGGTEDRTVEFGPDESMDSLLDAGGHLNETHTFDGSADFMVTRIDTLNPDGSLGSSNRHVQPVGAPGKAGGQSGSSSHFPSSPYWPAQWFGWRERHLESVRCVKACRQPVSKRAGTAHQD